MFDENFAFNFEDQPDGTRLRIQYLDRTDNDIVLNLSMIDFLRLFGAMGRIAASWGR